LIHYSHEHHLIWFLPEFFHLLGFFEFPEIGAKTKIFHGAFTWNGLGMMY
jgi:hypothetical protein